MQVWSCSERKTSDMFAMCVHNFFVPSFSGTLPAPFVFFYFDRSDTDVTLKHACKAIFGYMRLNSTPLTKDQRVAWYSPIIIVF